MDPALAGLQLHLEDARQGAEIPLTATIAIEDINRPEFRRTPRYWAIEPVSQPAVAAEFAFCGVSCPVGITVVYGVRFAWQSGNGRIAIVRKPAAPLATDGVCTLINGDRTVADDNSSTNRIVGTSTGVAEERGLISLEVGDSPAILNFRELFGGGVVLFPGDQFYMRAVSSNVALDTCSCWGIEYDF